MAETTVLVYLVGTPRDIDAETLGSVVPAACVGTR